MKTRSGTNDPTRRGVWSRLVAVGAAFAVLVAIAVASAVPVGAVAVDNPTVGVATCASDGTYHITWTLTNTTGAVLQIDNWGSSGIYSFGLDGPTPNPIPPGGTSVVHTIDTPGNSVGTATLTFNLSWTSFGVPMTGSSVGNVTLDGTCVLTGSLFHGLAPARILDSRPGNGNIGGYTSPWGGGTTRDVTVGGAGGVPADADAVVLNVTVTDTTAASYLTVWPAGQTQPTVSSLNWSAGTTIPNAVTVKLPASGKVSIFNFAGNADVVFDVAGYYSSSGDDYTPVPPARVLDSRPGGGNIGGYTTPWGPGTTRDVTVGGAGGIPSWAISVVLNVTVTDTTAPSYLTVWPADQTQPPTSSLNWAPGTTIPNQVTIPLPQLGSGRISIFNFAGNANVVVDVAGYYMIGIGQPFHALDPARVLDSRPGGGNTGGYTTPWGPNATRNVTIGGLDGVPVDAAAVVLNTTATNTTAGSFLTVWPAGISPPTVSNLNWRLGQTIPNAIAVSSAPRGTISMNNLTGNVDVITNVARPTSASLCSAGRLSLMVLAGVAQPSAPWDRW